MVDYYYEPWQYELREHLPSFRQATTAGRLAQIPDPITATVLTGVYFLAYAPLLQPGPPAKTPTSFPIYNLGGFVV